MSNRTKERIVGIIIILSAICWAACIVLQMFLCNLTFKAYDFAFSLNYNNGNGADVVNAILRQTNNYRYLNSYNELLNAFHIIIYSGLALSILWIIFWVATCFDWEMDLRYMRIMGISGIVLPSTLAIVCFLIENYDLALTLLIPLAAFIVGGIVAVIVRKMRKGEPSKEYLMNKVFELEQQLKAMQNKNQ